MENCDTPADVDYRVSAVKTFLTEPHQISVCFKLSPINSVFVYDQRILASDVKCFMDKERVIHTHVNLEQTCTCANCLVKQYYSPQRYYLPSTYEAPSFSNATTLIQPTPASIVPMYIYRNIVSVSYTPPPSLRDRGALDSQRTDSPHLDPLRTDSKEQDAPPDVDDSVSSTCDEDTLSAVSANEDSASDEFSD